MAYDVNPRLLLKRLKDSKQPLIGIKFYGPATTKVSLACVGCADNANDAVIAGILAEISGPKPPVQGDTWESRLRQEFES
jgi:hypothetical protein